MQQMCNSVVGHVESRVGERAHQEFRSPREASAKTVGTRAGPCVVQPVQRSNKLVVGLCVVAIAAHVLQCLIAESAPFRFAVGDEPLIDEGSNTLITGPRDNTSIGLRILNRLVVVKQLLQHKGFGVLDSHAFEFSNQHGTKIESMLVADILGFIQLVFVMLILDLHIVAKLLGSTSSVLGHVDNLNQILRDPFLLHVVLGLLLFVVTQILQSTPISWRITGYTGYHSSSLFHINGEHRQGVDETLFTFTQWRTQQGADQLLTGHIEQTLLLAPLTAVFLKGKVTAGTM
mmetsp:Transcript_4620/g.11408  ORF Transcript_4620/g.11408 Transcript_4620/m.11408 type:complete len:289 (-) Transcript_4620:1133-1999(-)